MSEKLAFHINEMYRNRKGWFMVLEINENQMLIRYENSGKKQTTNINDQRRFIANLERDEEHLHDIAKDRDRFFLLVEKCNQYYRSGHDLSKFREIIQMHRDSDALAPLLHHPSFFWSDMEYFRHMEHEPKGSKIGLT